MSSSPAASTDPGAERLAAAIDASDFAVARALILDRLTSGAIAELDAAAIDLLADTWPDPDPIRTALLTALDGDLDGIAPLDCLSLAGSLLTLTANSGNRDDDSRDAALLLLSLVSAQGASGWTWLIERDLLPAIDRSVGSSIERIAFLELLTDAPADTGLRATAIVQLEALGFANLASPRRVREIEIALHAAGASDAAYRLEAASESGDHRPRHAVRRDPLAGHSIVLAGGSSALRRRAERALRGLGASAVRAIPSSNEATRSGREIDAVVAGCDLAILVVRFLTHSTSDQVRAAAQRAGIPTVIAGTPTVSSICRAALDRLATS